MKRVKFLMDVAIASHGSVKTGAVLDLEDDQAKELIKLKCAESTQDLTPNEQLVADAEQVKAPAV